MTYRTGWISVKSRVGLVAAFLAATIALPASSMGAGLAERVKRHTLDNGMTLLALPKPGAPVVSLQMTFRAGGVDEPAGHTGVAHLLEHMLFKGTTDLGAKDWKAESDLLPRIEAAGKRLDSARRNNAPDETVAKLVKELKKLQALHLELISPGEINDIYKRNGAVGFNAFTTADLTSYVVSLPSNRLELWARVESERMRDPVFRQFYVERDVVLQERRQRTDGSPGGLLYEALISTAYSAHPYGDPVIGWPADLASLDVDFARKFYEEHYGPHNAVIVAVGDVDPARFFMLMDRWFGDLERGATGETAITREPVQRGPRRAWVEFDAEPRIYMGFHKPTLPHRDDYVFDLIQAVLFDGSSSRLVGELVDRRGLAIGISASNGIPGARYDNLFALFATPAPGVTVEELEAAIWEELERLKREPPTDGELKGIFRRMEADRVRRLLSTAGLARTLSYFETVAGDFAYIEEHPKVLATVTPEEVSSVAAKYLTETNSTIVALKRKGAE